MLCCLWPSFSYVKNTIQAAVFFPVLHLFLVSYHPIVPFSSSFFFVKHDTRWNKYFTCIYGHRCKWDSWTIGYKHCISVSAVISQYQSVFCNPLINFQEKNNLVTSISKKTLDFHFLSVWRMSFNCRNTKRSGFLIGSGWILYPWKMKTH